MLDQKAQIVIPKEKKYHGSASDTVSMLSLPYKDPL